MRTYQKILGGMVLGGVTYLGIQLLDEPPNIPCDTPTGTLVWNNPESFDTSTDTILIFAKKVPLGTVTYINIETPTKAPGTYGTPDTNLANLETAIPVNIQYENDPLAQLIYADTFKYVNVVGLDDSTYFFATFNVSSGVYSNAKLSSGKTIAIEPVQEVVLANSRQLQWIKPICYDTDTIIAVLSEDSISIAPSGFAAQYLIGLNTNWSSNTAFFNGSDDTEGKVMYVDFGDRESWSSLPESKLWVFFWINRDDCWSKATYIEFDTR